MEPLFSTDPDCPSGGKLAMQKWSILIVDDDDDVHKATLHTLKRFSFFPQLDIIHAYSAKEAIDQLKDKTDIALVMLDVVMESHSSGFDVIKFIREEQGNHDIQIVIRTGQPGYAPIRDVIVNYDINDYIEKTQLSADRLFSLVCSSIRAYQNISSLNKSRRGLDTVINATSSVFQLSSLDTFCQGVINELIAFFKTDDKLSPNHYTAISAFGSNDDFKVVASSENFEHAIGKLLGQTMLDDALYPLIESAIDECKTFFDQNSFATCFDGGNGIKNLVLLSGVHDLSTIDHRLIELFCKNVSIAFKNLNLSDDLLNEIKQRKEAEENANMLARFPEELPHPVMRVAENGKILYINNEAKRALDCWLSDDKRFVPPMWKKSIAESLNAGAHRLVYERIGEIDFCIDLAPVPELKFVNFFARDITEQQKSSDKLEYLTNHDALTGLPNRYLFLRKLNWDITLSKRKNKKLALALIDLDHFKNANDTYGHHIGDALLCAVSRRIGHCIRNTDTLARLGGDEFSLILPLIEDTQSIIPIIDRIIYELNQPLEISGKSISTQCSIGVTLYPDDSEDISTLQINADLALHKAKNNGRNNSYFFDENLYLRTQRAHSIERGLRKALKNDGLNLFYQPKVYLDDLSVSGLEALVRWTDDELGSVSPAEFIPIAEKTDLVKDIGSWVIDQSCQQLAEWDRLGQPKVNVAINLSAKQFKDENLPIKLKSVLEKYNLDPSRMELEVTETSVMMDIHRAINVMKLLCDIGFIITIDDFGTGYSSLSYLLQLPISKLKIDKSFIMSLDVSPDAEALAETIVGMAKNIHLSVVAEGIEKPDQLEILRGLHCKEGQGYLISRPIPANEIVEFLKCHKISDKTQSH